MSDITPDTYPAGTRVVKTTTGDRGTVVGWARDSIGVRWDGGGYSSSPASHGGLRVYAQDVNGAEIKAGARVERVLDGERGTVRFVDWTGVGVDFDYGSDALGRGSAWRLLTMDEALAEAEAEGDLELARAATFALFSQDDVDHEEHAAVDAQVAAEREAEAEPLSCCDGTGWTGDPKAPCAEHYVPSDLAGGMFR